MLTSEQTLLLWGAGLDGEIILFRELPLLKLEFKCLEWRTMKDNVTVEWFFNVITYKKHSDCYTVELHLYGRWLSGSPIVRLGLALRVHFRNGIVLQLCMAQIFPSVVQYI